MNLTFKQLRYFEALVRHAHFGRAAEASAVSQPALSIQIKELEQTLGTTLFERGPRHVRLTAFGEVFALRVRHILRSVDELGELARAARDNMVGRLRIGVIPTIAPYLLPSFIAELGRQHPELDVHIRETVTPRLLEDLADGRLDTAILALPTQDSALTEMALFDEDLVLVRADAARDTPVPSVEALRAMRLLLLEEGHCFRDQALSFCGMTSNLRRDGLDGSSLSTLVQMVGAGIGVTLIPEMAVAVETRAAPVCVGQFAAPRPTRTIGMVWRRTNPMADQLTEIAKIVGQAAVALRAAHAAEANAETST